MCHNIREVINIIYTCTLNPAIDLFVAMDSLKPHAVNRTFDEDYQANGKGISVSIVLNKWGVSSVALGFVGGFTGDYIKSELKRIGIQTDFVDINGITRINIFVNAETEFKIVNKGPKIESDSIEKMLQKLKTIPRNSTLFVSGSVPNGVDEDIYVEIAKIAQQNDVNLILDISSKKLLDCLPYSPYLIKPNEDELAHLFGKDHLSDEKIVMYGKRLLHKGARQIIVSLGEKGAIYFSSEKTVKVSSVSGQVVNTACAGDTMLATFAAKRLAGQTVEEAIAYASAAGASTAFSKGISDLTDVEELVKHVQVSHL